MLTNLALAILTGLVVLAFVRINRLERKLTMSDASNAAAIRGMTAQMAKVKSEVLAAIAKLEGQIGSTPETDAAIEEARTALQGLDDMNVDAADPAAASKRKN